MYSPAALDKANLVDPEHSGKMLKYFILTGYFLVSAAAVVYAHFDGREFLGDVEVDGFSNQVIYIWNYVGGRNSILDLEPLLWIHALRALVAYVFVTIEDVGGSGLVASVLLLLTIPVARVFSDLRRGYLVLSIPIAGALISERAFLVIIAVGYLILFMRNGKAIYYLPLSFIFSNLSSGSVMNNLIISSTIVRNYRRKSVGLYTYIVFQAASFIISALDKYQGFSEQLPGYDSTVYGASGVEAIFSRNTLFVSAVEGNYSRLIAYAVLAAIALGLFAFALRSREYRGYVMILVSVIPSLVFEGLGFISLLIPILLLLAGEKLPWRPRERELAVD